MPRAMRRGNPRSASGGSSLFKSVCGLGIAILVAMAAHTSVSTESVPAVPVLEGANIRVSDGVDDQLSTSQAVAFDPVSGRFAVGIYRFRNSAGELLGQPMVRTIGADGSMPSPTVNLDPSSFLASGPAVLGSESGGFLAVWNRQRLGSFSFPHDIIAQPIDESGNAVAPSVDVTPPLDGINQLHSALAWNSVSGQFLAVWGEESPRDGRPYRDRIMGATLAGDGSVSSGPFVIAEPPLYGTPFTSSGHMNGRPSVAFDAASGTFLVAWRRLTLSAGAVTSVLVQASRLDGSGIPLDSGFQLAPAYTPPPGYESAFNYSEPKVAARGGVQGGFFVVWSDARDAGISGLDVLVAKVNASWPVNEGYISLLTSFGDEIKPDLTFARGAGLLTWVEPGPGGRVRAATFSPDTWAIGLPVSVSDTPSTFYEGQFNPAVRGDGSGRFLIAWTDRRLSSGYQVFAQRLSFPENDPDADSAAEAHDNCPMVHNPFQDDLDRDGIGDACDSDASDGPTMDSDGDGVPNVGDPLPSDGPAGDQDMDGVLNSNDRCPVDADPAQEDGDQDGVGDACDVRAAVVHSFDLGEGGNELAVGLDGLLYGTTRWGGTFGAGTLFRMDLDGAITYLHSFGETPTDGVGPQAGVAVMPDGSLWGTTVGGGAVGLGTIFTVSAAGSYAVVHSFDGAAGRAPVAGLLAASDGALYGVAPDDDANGWGVLFRVSPGNGFEVVRSFDAEAYRPVGGLAEGTDGRLYGTTALGGIFRSGTAFSIAMDGSDFSILRHFADSTGGSPQTALEPMGDGRFHGTSVDGLIGGGALFRLGEDGTYSVLYDFQAESPAPVRGPDGHFYGVDGETLVRVTPAGFVWPFHDFSNEAPNGTGRHSGGVVAPNGFIYAATEGGGDHGRGFVYRIETRVPPNTPAGANVEVQPVDNTGSQAVTFAFEHVTGAGVTSVLRSTTGLQPPAGFALGTPATYFELTTTAAYTGRIRVCIDYSSSAYVDEAQLGLFHFEGAEWVNRTVSLDVLNNLICADVDSLSPFAVFERTQAASVVTVPPASQPYSGVVLSAGLVTANGDPVPGRTLQFAVNGTAVGSATTGSAGTATLALAPGQVPAGLYSSGVEVSFDGDAEFSASTGVGDLSVARAPLVIRASDASRVLGAPNPPLTGTVQGLIGGDTVGVGYTTPATPASAAGTYPIVPVVTDSAGRLANYDTQVINGTLTVTYDVCVLFDQARPVKSGATLPIKLRLCNAMGSNASAAAVVVTATGLFRVSNQTTGEVQDAGNANPDYQFRYDPVAALYIFNFKTAGLTSGEYRLVFVASNDPVPHSVVFQVK